MCSPIDRQEGVDELAEVVGGQLEVGLGSASLLQGGELGLEALGLHAVHDLAVHLDQAAVGVPGEAIVPGHVGEAAHRVAVQTEVENRVHHARHRDRRARADRQQQGIRLVAEALARLLLQSPHVLGDLCLEARGKLPSRLHEGATGVRRDREAGRHRHAEPRHLGKARSLAAEQGPSSGARFVEVVREAWRRRALSAIRAA